jgi:hypothetical protein
MLKCVCYKETVITEALQPSHGLGLNFSHKYINTNVRLSYTGTVPWVRTGNRSQQRMFILVHTVILSHETITMLSFKLNNVLLDLLQK